MLVIMVLSLVSTRLFVQRHTYKHCVSYTTSPNIRQYFIVSESLLFPRAHFELLNFSDNEALFNNIVVHFEKATNLNSAVALFVIMKTVFF